MNPPYLITRKGNAAKAAKNWSVQYKLNEAEPPWPDKESTYDALKALGDSPSPDDVDRITGNRTWTAVRCSQCNQECEAGVVVGAPHDYGSSTATLCMGCLKQAVEVMQREALAEQKVHPCAVRCDCIPDEVR
jgi:hypothetical protein